MNVQRIKWFNSDNRTRISATKTLLTTKKRALYLLFLGFLCLAFTNVNAKALLISKNGTAKYVIQENQLIEVQTDRGSFIEGTVQIVSDSTISVADSLVFLDQIVRIRIEEGNKVGKGIGIFGLAAGTGMVFLGGSMMRQETIIERLVMGMAGAVAVMAGVVVDAVSAALIASNGDKWINIQYRNYQLTVF
jgi:hypothetical protein